MIVYRASELGSCTRRLTLARVGYDALEPPPKFMEYFARGDATEIEVKESLRADRQWMIEREQEEVTLQISNEIAVVGHLDGVSIDWPNDPGTHTPLPERVLEIKRMNNTYWNVVKAGGWYVDGLMEKYRWQLSVYMLATGLEAVLVARNGDTGEDLFLYAEQPFHAYNDIAARVLVIEGRARSFGTLEDLGECDRADYPCPFYYTHTEEEKRDALEGDEAEELEGLGVAYQSAKQRESEAKAAGESLRSSIGSLLGERDKVSAGRVRVTRYAGKRTSLDKDQMRRDGIDVDKYESVKFNKPTVRITVADESSGPTTEDA